MNPLSHRRRLAAFTLVELLTVIGIIALLTGLLLPALGLVRDRARATATSQRIAQIGNACEAYRSLTRRYPAEQGVLWTAGVPAWAAGFPSSHREAVSYAGSPSSQALGDLLERSADLLIPAEGLAKGDPVDGYKHVVDGWGRPLRYQRLDELAGGVLTQRATYWFALPKPPAIAGVTGKREGFIIYSLGKGLPIPARVPTDPKDDTSTDPGRYWSEAKHLVYRQAGE